MEDDRLNREIEALQPVSLRPHVNTELKYRMIPSLFDGKQKKIKSNTA